MTAQQKNLKKNSMTHAQPIVQYGYRDDDDDEDSEDERRPGFFGGVLQRQRNGSANKMPSGLEVISKLGASLSNSMNFDLGGSDDSGNLNTSHDGEDDNDRYDSDDGSVSSKASVASKASKQLKKLGGRLGFKNRNRRASDSESHEEDSSDEDDDGGMEVDRSVSGRIRKVTGKISNVLKVGGRRSSLSDGEDSDSDDEEDLLNPNTSQRVRATNPFFRSSNKSRFGRDHVSRPLHDGKVAPSMRRCKTDSEQNEKSGSFFRRSQTEAPQLKKSHPKGPKEPFPTQNTVRRTKSDVRSKRNKEEQRTSAKSQGRHLDEQDGHVSDLSQSDSESAHPTFNPQAQYGGNIPIRSATASNIPGSEAWSMNVTEEMWEELTSDVEDDSSISRKNGWKMNVPKELLTDLPKISPNQKPRNLRS